MVYSWAQNSGMVNTVCTLFELVGGDNTTDEGGVNYFIFKLKIEVKIRLSALVISG